MATDEFKPRERPIMNRLYRSGLVTGLTEGIYEELLIISTKWLFAPTRAVIESAEAYRPRKWIHFVLRSTHWQHNV
uniref:Uncharacterized protein n=1 Tax=Timema cristinae TaxID=61476 RepID=A0A7R9DKL8_TIMCR|nr:unnamed protein product [Timema cristinae]